MRPRINDLEIRDILGTEHREFRPGSLTIISGANGTGKTSLIDALLSVFEGGHDPGLLRVGAKKGFIRIGLNTGAEILKTVTVHETKVVITDPDGKPIPAPQTWIRRLADSLTVEPARLLTAKPKDLMSVLLQVMPISFAPEEIVAQIPKEAIGFTNIPPQAASLDHLAAVRQDLYDSRTGVSSVAREAADTVKSLRHSLPPAEEKDWAAEAKRLEQELAATKTAKTEAENETRAANFDAEREVARYFDEQIKELEAKRKARIAELHAERDAGLADIERQARPILDGLLSRVAEARERATAQAKVAGTLENIEKFARVAREKQQIADRISLGIMNLDKLRQSRLNSLPIPGFEFPGGGVVLLDGVQWEHTNLARRIEIVFQIWDLWDPPFGFIDDAEHFDPEMWQAFREYCIQSKRQVFAARVGDGPLTIETIGEPAQEVQAQQ